MFPYIDMAYEFIVESQVLKSILHITCNCLVYWMVSNQVQLRNAWVSLETEQQHMFFSIVIKMERIKRYLFMAYLHGFCKGSIPGTEKKREFKWLGNMRTGVLYTNRSILSQLAWFMGRTWGPARAGGPHVGPMNLTIWGGLQTVGNSLLTDFSWHIWNVLGWKLYFMIHFSNTF